MSDDDEGGPETTLGTGPGDWLTILRELYSEDIDEIIHTKLTQCPWMLFPMCLHFSPFYFTHLLR